MSIESEAPHSPEDAGGPQVGPGAGSPHHDDWLEVILHHAGHLVPEQNPLEQFVHHNTLHAYEHLPFEEALRAASAELGTAAALPEVWLRGQLAAGRIAQVDLEAEIALRVPDRELPGLPVTERGLVALLCRHGLSDEAGPALAWRLSDGGALRALPDDLPPAARAALEAQGPAEVLLPALWSAARALRPRVALAPPAPGLRPRDRIHAAGLGDPDPMVHQALVRWCGAYLDTGHAYWPMMERDRGFLQSVLLHAASGGPDLRDWLAGLPAVAAGLLRRPGGAPTADQIVEEELQRLQIDRPDAERFIVDTLLALRGWAGMVHRLEARPDLWPEPVARPRLVELLAVRLVLDRLGAEHFLNRGGVPAGPLVQRLARLPAPPPVERADPAWTLLQVALLLGLGADGLRRLGPTGLAALEDVIARTTPFSRQLILQTAYERTYRRRMVDAVASHWPLAAHVPPPARPSAQVVLCMDDREESFRRYLEEQDPLIDTYGLAGFFGVAMMYRGLDGAKARPLCPAPVTPRHLVEEVVVDERAGAHAAGAAVRARKAKLKEGAYTARDTLLRGSLLSLGGWLALVPLASQLLSPRLHARLTQRPARQKTRLRLLRPSPDARDGRGLLLGYSFDEMADIVTRVLQDIGLVKRFARLVAILGHGSHSANNPHRGAYDCGACGGGQGGPNARAFAVMANSAEVRQILRGRGIDVPDDTFFLGGFHDTANDAVDWLDLDLVPPSHAADLAALNQKLAVARENNALERARRFMSAPLDLSPAQALAHVEARAEDLAQPRPELGHATNAVALIGRRQWSRGLFLDRRAFLISYDPSIDPDAQIISRILAAAGPVGAGISLEYFFSFMDPALYGCGTKLPHNVTGFLGVMDGYSSDLRTGLPWQMVEIHEPMRLLLIIEATPAMLGKVLERHPPVAQLVVNQWVQIVSLDPETGALQHFVGAGAGEGWQPWAPPAAPLPHVRTSVEWFRGQRDHLLPATIIDGLPRPGGR
jgi:uncharacterized protein YbcC (UPF0753/DUF2309 family)